MMMKFSALEGDIGIRLVSFNCIALVASISAETSREAGLRFQFAKVVLCDV